MKAKVLNNFSQSTIDKIVNSPNFKKFKLSCTSSLYIERIVPKDYTTIRKHLAKSLILDDRRIFTMPIALRFYRSFLDGKNHLRGSISPHDLGGECPSTWVNVYESIVKYYNLNTLVVKDRNSNSGNNMVCELGTGELIPHQAYVAIRSSLKWQIL